MGRNQRYSDDPRHIPTWAATVHDCRVRGVRVKACCSFCNLFSVAKLKLIEREKGPAFNLFDKEPRCPRCGRLGHFMYSPGRGTPMRPMRTGR